MKTPVSAGLGRAIRITVTGYRKRVVLTPNLSQCFMPSIQRTREKTGCLQVIRGSSPRADAFTSILTGHRLARTRSVCRRFLKTVRTRSRQMNPGDVLFFHANLLHRSGPKSHSEHPRWVGSGWAQPKIERSLYKEFGVHPATRDRIDADSAVREDRVPGRFDDSQAKHGKRRHGLVGPNRFHQCRFHGNAEIESPARSPR